MSNGRTVSTDALETLGTIIDHTQKRDAIHLAVMPVQAGEDLPPGCDIKIVDGRAWGTNEIEDGKAETGLMIVDPFLLEGPSEGDWFWAVLRPRLVTSLRHVWSHPEFPDEGTVLAPSKLKIDPVVAARQWLENYADELNLDFDRLMDGAHDYLNTGDYITEGSNLEGEYTSDEFWTHYETFTGTVIPQDDRGNFFNCSC